MVFDKGYRNIALKGIKNVFKEKGIKRTFYEYKINNIFINIYRKKCKARILRNCNSGLWLATRSGMDYNIATAHPKNQFVTDNADTVTSVTVSAFDFYKTK